MLSSLFKRPWLLAALVVVLIVVGFRGSVAVVDHLESDPAFCNACHLPDGSPLHGLKLDLARSTPPLDLTALHFNPRRRHRNATPVSPPRAFSCADCHRGYGWFERSQVLWEAAYNTLRYAVLPIQEPERLVRPISNAACEACHPGIPGDDDKERFHGIKAHLDQVTVLCMECHRSHAPSRKARAHIESLVAAMKATCRRCHKGEELAPPVTQLLATVREEEKSRLNLDR